MKAALFLLPLFLSRILYSTVHSTLSTSSCECNEIFSKLNHIFPTKYSPAVVEPVPVGGVRVGAGVGRRVRGAAAGLVPAVVHPPRVEVLVLPGVVLQLGRGVPTITALAGGGCGGGGGDPGQPREGGPPVRQRPVHPAGHRCWEGAAATTLGGVSISIMTCSSVL